MTALSRIAAALERIADHLDREVRPEKQRNGSDGNLLKLLLPPRWRCKTRADRIVEIVETYGPDARDIVRELKREGFLKPATNPHDVRFYDKLVDHIFGDKPE